MAKKIYRYEGARKNKVGVEKSFDVSILNSAKIERLKSKGWVEVTPKPKPKPKPKKSKK
tara:strand:+ start:398 stop:574 length:177 start_codon:yes stop_codon:yes gene_type:complete